MSIQSQFNDEALNMLPEIKKLIISCSKFEANQIYNKTLERCLTSNKSLLKMSAHELEEFQDNLIEIFKFKEWI